MLRLRGSAPIAGDAPLDRVVDERDLAGHVRNLPLEDLEQAAFVARAMADRLVEALASFGAAPFRIVVEAEAFSNASFLSLTIFSSMLLST